MKKQITSLRASTWLLGLFLWLPLSSLAHSLYYEPSSNGELILRFGEFGDTPETSPGYLDELDPVYCWNKVSNQPALAPKQSNRFTTPLSSADSALSESGYSIMTRGGTPPRKPYFYARWIGDWKQPAEAQLTLDLIPTGVPGELKASFRNQLIPNITAVLHTPSGKEIEIQSDSNGLIRFELSGESGIHMLKIGRFREELSGFQTGKLFDLSSHNCSVTWNQP